MQTHIVPVGFDYDRLIAPLVALAPSFGLSEMFTNARIHARTYGTGRGCSPLPT
jgi:hypothetical protein